MRHGKTVFLLQNPCEHVRFCSRVTAAGASDRGAGIYLAKDCVLLIKGVKVGVQGEVELRGVHVLSSTCRHSKAFPRRPSPKLHERQACILPQHSGSLSDVDWDTGELCTCHGNKPLPCVLDGGVYLIIKEPCLLPIHDPAHGTARELYTRTSPLTVWNSPSGKPDSQMRRSLTQMLTCHPSQCPQGPLSAQ